MTATRRSFLVGAAALAALPDARPAAADERAADKAGSKFRLGLVTYNLGANFDLPTLLKVCKAGGVAAVECRTTHKHGVEPSLSPEERKDVRKRFEDSGVVFWGCGSVCEFHSTDPKVVEKNVESCKEFIGLVAALGGKGVKVRPNGLPKDVPVPKTLEQIGKALVECGKAAESAGVEIWVEVHGPGTQEPANMKTIMEACGHKSVGLTWNSNPTDIKNGTIAESFALLRPWVKSCHINDIYRDAVKAGKGQYPYRELFRLLREANYDRYTLIEVGKTLPDAASTEELLRYYKALWTELCKG